jgi:hypothetical protein
LTYADGRRGLGWGRIGINSEGRSMDETEWQNCNNSETMLEWLREKPVATPRKLRLFAAFCCEWREDWLPDDTRCRDAIDVAERHADSTATDAELAGVHRLAEEVQLLNREGYGVVALTLPDSWEAAHGVSIWPEYLGWDPDEEAEERKWQATVLREILGPLPFRPIAVDPAWLAWNHGTVPAIARHVYDDRAFHDLPILADALEDAGCTDADILAHCRGGGEHVRGCWVVDLLLGKQ